MIPAMRAFLPPRFLRAFSLLLLAGLLSLARCQAADPLPIASTNAPASSTNSGYFGPLHLEDVLRSVTNQYPPLLAALIERDIANGRLRSAQGAFDFNIFADGLWYPGVTLRPGPAPVINPGEGFWIYKFKAETWRMNFTPPP